MRSIWNGAISFGLVSIPVKLVNATENHSVSFRQVHMEDGGRIRYRKVCEAEDREVDSAEIGKGYQDADGSIIPITDEDLASLPIPTAKTIEIVAFVPADRVDPLQMDTAYYLSANGVPATKPYTLLREALRRTDKVALARYALRGRERLGMLRVVDDVIAMHGLLWPDEIREPEGAAPDARVTVRDAELDLADALMDTLGEVDIATLHDDYRSAVEELVAAKVQGGAATERAPAADTGGGKVIDLMAALENSVRAARSARGGEAEAGQAAEGDPVAEVTRLSSRGAKRAGSKAAPAKARARGGAAGKAAPTGAAARGGAPASKASSGGASSGKAPAGRASSAESTSAGRASAAEPSPAGSASSAKSASAAKDSPAEAGGAGSRDGSAKRAGAKKTAAKKTTTGRTTGGKGAGGKAAGGKAAAGKAAPAKGGKNAAPAKKGAAKRRASA
ncbi:Ku protein [Streptomyces sp. A1499]|uniref:non-homologous end joining protein Ku n=1 Tax=Streptomyces sp. A1499 TaxID=2563104 RepID=UPI00109E9999|nr:Ku protein [Streptomyces sp. A1499]THC52386.1 Ku protein [Streptomyces sp. A1499]